MWLDFETINDPVVLGLRDLSGSKSSCRYFLRSDAGVSARRLRSPTNHFSDEPEQATPEHDHHDRAKNPPARTHIHVPSAHCLFSSRVVRIVLYRCYAEMIHEPQLSGIPAAACLYIGVVVFQ